MGSGAEDKNMKFLGVSAERVLGFDFEGRLEKLAVGREVKRAVTKGVLEYRRVLEDVFGRVVRSVGRMRESDVENIKDYTVEKLEEAGAKLYRKQRTLGTRDLVEELIRSDKVDIEILFENLEGSMKVESEKRQRLVKTNLQLQGAYRELQSGRVGQIGVGVIYNSALCEVADDMRYDADARIEYAQRRVGGLILNIIDEYLDDGRFEQAEKGLRKNKEYLSAELYEKIGSRIGDKRRVLALVKRIRGSNILIAEQEYLKLPVRVQRLVREELRRWDGAEMAGAMVEKGGK